jgi:hypothetical protein
VQATGKEMVMATDAEKATARETDSDSATVSDVVTASVSASERGSESELVLVPALASVDEASDALAESDVEPVQADWVLSVPETVPLLLSWDHACLTLQMLSVRVFSPRFSFAWEAGFAQIQYPSPAFWVVAESRRRKPE